jgi:hypothetical protein
MKLEILKQAVMDSRDGITISDNLVDDNLRFPRYFVFQQVDFMQPARPDFVR